ncbi:MAG: hypothetical protein M0018_04400 [Nitrospiraceae bacterium]|nr:hypothetical protein [Nitrospiraceae bacterium]
MSLELALLVLESVLLIFTILILLYSIKEGRSRSRLLTEIDRAARTFTRLEYFLVVVDSMTDAKSEVRGVITGRPPSGGDVKRTKDIISAIEKSAGAGVSLKYILPRFQDRLKIGHQYKNAGAEIRYITCPSMHDLRYMTVDNDVSIIGLPEKTGDKEATKKGYRVVSEGLTHIFKQYFEECWASAIDYDQYLLEVIHHTNASPKQLAQELGLEEAEVARVWDKQNAKD